MRFCIAAIQYAPAAFDLPNSRRAAEKADTKQQGCDRLDFRLRMMVCRARPALTRCISKGLVDSGAFGIVPRSRISAVARAWTVASAIIFRRPSSPMKMAESSLIRSSCLGTGLADAKQLPLRSRALTRKVGRVSDQVTRVPGGHDGPASVGSLRS
jgi:hypothetical protein